MELTTSVTELQGKVDKLDTRVATLELQDAIGVEFVGGFVACNSASTSG